MMKTGAPKADKHPALAKTRADQVVAAGLPVHARAYQHVRSATEIGAFVRASRRRMKLSQQAFADLSGVGRRFISDLEGGKPTLEFNKVLQVCEAAGVRIYMEDSR